MSWLGCWLALSKQKFGPLWCPLNRGRSPERSSGVLEMEHRLSRDYAQGADVPQFGGQCVGDGGSDEVVFRIMAQILERQHRKSGVSCPHPLDRSDEAVSLARQGLDVPALARPPQRLLAAHRDQRSVAGCAAHGDYQRIIAGREARHRDVGLCECDAARRQANELDRRVLAADGS